VGHHPGIGRSPRPQCSHQEISRSAAEKCHRANDRGCRGRRLLSEDLCEDHREGGRVADSPRQEMPSTAYGCGAHPPTSLGRSDQQAAPSLSREAEGRVRARPDQLLHASPQLLVGGTRHSPHCRSRKIRIDHLSRLLRRLPVHRIQAHSHKAANQRDGPTAVLSPDPVNSRPHALV
ncbi:hypothetical protein PENTCL1PPCAC_25137, partial [Pristionchus entomophagus]